MLISYCRGFGIISIGYLIYYMGEWRENGGRYGREIGRRCGWVEEFWVGGRLVSWGWVGSIRFWCLLMDFKNGVLDDILGSLGWQY